MNKIRLDYTRNLIILSSKNKNYFLSRLGIFYFLLFFLAVTNNTPLIAEGTKSIAPSTADETALFIGGGNTGFTGGSYGLFAWKGSDSKLAFNIQSIQEKVYLGFSIPKNNREFQDSGGAGLVEDLIFRILDQDGVPISCFGNTTINGEVWQTLSSTDANISSRAMADNGPVQLGNVGGYTAFVLDLTTCGQKTGNYFIEFYTTDASYNPNIQGAGFYVEYFDITVAEPINSIITPITGRVWSNNWCLSLKRDGDGPFDRAFNGAFYVCSIEGFVTKINFNSGVNNRPEAGNNDQRSGFRAGTFNVSFNTTGPANTGDIIADRKSLQDLNSPNAELFVFLNEPDESFCPTQEVGEIKARTEFLTGCPLSFCINIEANKKGQIEVLIEGADSNGILDQPTERFLAYNIMDTDSVDNPDNPGFNYSFCLPWDGKDGLGNQQNLANMSIRAAFSQGVYHFPVYDAEFNDDGFTVETIRPALGPQKLFYDDTMISEANNTGEPKDGSNGCTAPCHRWTGEWGNIADKDEVYGNFNTINTWWFANTGANDLTSFIKRIKPPNLICPANVNDCPGTSTDPSVTGLATSPDDANCPVIIDYSDVVEDTLCGAKTITRTWKAYFQGIPEPSTTCIQIIKLEDIIAPIPPAPPVNMVGQCAAAVPASVSLTATDNCDGEITADPVDVRTDRDCANNFTIVRTWTFADACGNSSSITQNITVNDTIAPIPPAPPADFVGQCDSDMPPVVNLTATDNCDGEITAGSIDVRTDGNCDNSYTLVRTWTFFDACGNSSSITQNITVNDTIAPIPPAPPADFVGQCDSDMPPAVNLTATDNCDGEITAGPIDVRTDGNCDNSYTLVRTWTFFDACGNSSSVSQNITINDTIAPVPPAPPADVLGQCAADMPPAVNLTATDNCDGEITAGPIDVRTDGNCDNSYTLVRTWTFFDACGNSSSVSQNITINDTIAPVPPAPPADVLGQCAADVPAPVSLTATDNCDGAITADPVDVRTDGNCANNFTIVRTWTFADACGNSSSITQNITVNDTIAPIPPAPPEDILVCLDDPPPPVSLTAVDNCDRLITVDPVDEVMSETRTIRTWTFIDDCGNSSSISQEISICEPRIIFDTYCTFTQGFYGNPGGKFDGKTTTEILDAALAQGPIIIGQPGRSLTINSSKCILKLLPGGGVSTVLPVGEVIVGNNCSPAPIATKKNGTIGNILIAQVITLTINTRVDGNLNTLPLENLCFEVPQNILIALPPNPDVGDLLTYANAVLAGAAVQNLLAVNDVVTAVNESFDECAAPCNLPDDSMKINLSDDSVIKNDFSKPEPISEVYEKRTFSIAPNPAFTSTFIDLHQFEGEKVRLIINTQMGQKVYEKTLQVNAEYKKEMIDVELLTNGLYFISVRSEEDPIIYTKKFVVRQVR